MEMLDLVIIACNAPPPSTLSHISLVAVLFITEVSLNKTLYKRRGLTLRVLPFDPTQLHVCTLQS